ncbi:MAG: PAS domain-containing sensor histidine kinase, partial [Methanobacteriota archaeon]
MTALATSGSSFVHWARAVLPAGGALPAEVWAKRHHAITVLLVLHGVGLFFYGLYTGHSVIHSLLEGGILLAFALLASIERIPLRVRTAISSVGLISASAILTHFSGGFIEAHFHFFVMLGVISLYQDWVPFLLSIAYVAVHHGTVGVFDPTSVYNHPAAWAHPWRWALIHATFVLGLSAANIANWAANEGLYAKVTASEASLARAQELARLGSAEFDLATGRLAWSDEMYRLAGIPRGTIVTLDTVRTLVVPDDRPAFDTALARMRETGEPFDLVHRIRRPDGVRTVHAQGHLVRDDAGRPLKMVGSVQDVTEQKETELGLERALSLQTATLESTADGILVVDSEGRIVSFNKQFVGMWRIPQEIVDSRDDARALAFVQSQLKDPEGFLRKVRELYAASEAESFDVLEFSDGRIFERYSKPQRLDTKVVGRVWSFRDVTQRRRAEEAERIAMRQALEIGQLQEMNQFKTQLLNTAAHELNTPLTPIRLQLHLLKHEESMQATAEDHHRSIEILDRNFDRLSRLIDSVLDVARLQSGKLRVERKPVDLSRIAAEAAESFAEPARKKGITLDVEPDGRLLVEADSDRIIQVMFNLLGNAIKFTPEGGTVTVTLLSVGDEAVVEVRDTGAGVAPAAHGRLFQPITQVHDPLERTEYGTGRGRDINNGIIVA